MPGSALAKCPNSDNCDGDGCYHHGKHKRRKDCLQVEGSDCPTCKPVKIKRVHTYTYGEEE